MNLGQITARTNNYLIKSDVFECVFFQFSDKSVTQMKSFEVFLRFR